MPKIEIEISDELKAFLDKEGVEPVRFGTVGRGELYIDKTIFGKLVISDCKCDNTVYEHLVVRKKLKWPPFLERTFAESFCFGSSDITLLDEKGLWCGNLKLTALHSEDLQGFKINTLYHKKNCI